MRPGLKGVGAARWAHLAVGALAAALVCIVPSTAAASGLAAEDHVFPAPAVDATAANSTTAPNGFAATAWVETASNSVAFSGRVGRRALKPGSYVATFVATAGSRSSLPKILRFKIVR